MVSATVGNPILQVNPLATLLGRRRIRFPFETLQRQPFSNSREKLLRVRIRSNGFQPGIQQNLGGSDTHVRRILIFNRIVNAPKQLLRPEETGRSRRDPGPNQSRLLL
jgi:hypothetical protein